MVGVEVEMHAFQAASFREQQPRPVPLFGPDSLSAALIKLHSQRPDWQFDTVGDQQDKLLNIQLEERDQITFEPGGQLEISSRPYPCLDDAISRVSSLSDILDRHLKAEGIELLQIGFNPWLNTDDLSLQMTKPRYQAMNEYFNAIGPYGREMMRLTCTIQVNLDFGSHDRVLAKRYLAANLLGPVATAIFAYSPITKGRPNGYKSYRSKIWQQLDHTRTGFPDLQRIATNLDRQTCVQVYMERLMAARVVFIEALGHRPMIQPLTFGEWLANGYEGVWPTAKDFETHLSLFFPEVRARGFMELRSVDVQSRVWQVVPACFFTALLYDDENLDRLLELLPVDQKQVLDYWQRSSYGLADPYLAKLAKQIMTMAVERFEKLPSCYQGNQAAGIFRAFARHFTQEGRSPADDILDSLGESGDAQLSPSTLRRVEDHWRDLIG